MFEKNNKIESVEVNNDGKTGVFIFMGILALTLAGGYVYGNENASALKTKIIPTELQKSSDSLESVIDGIKPVEELNNTESKPAEVIEPKKVKTPAETTSNSGSITIGATVLPVITCDKDLNCITNEPGCKPTVSIDKQTNVATIIGCI